MKEGMGIATTSHETALANGGQSVLALAKTGLAVLSQAGANPDFIRVPSPPVMKCSMGPRSVTSLVARKTSPQSFAWA